MTAARFLDSLRSLGMTNGRLRSLGMTKWGCARGARRSVRPGSEPACRAHTSRRSVRRLSPLAHMTSFHRWRHVLAAALLVFLVPLCLSAQSPLSVASPDGRTQVTITLDSGVVRYAVRHAGANVVMPSRLGFAFKGAPPL